MPIRTELAWCTIDAASIRAAYTGAAAEEPLSFLQSCGLSGRRAGTPAIVRALESGTALAPTGGMRYLSRPEHLRSALASVDSFIALRAGDSITRPRVDLVAIVPSGSMALITRVEAGVVVPATATLRSVVSLH